MTPAPTVAYDANGNTLSDPSGKQYTWDFENRLVQVVNPGAGTTTFRYDPFGRRIQKSGPLGTTNYLYDGINNMEEVDGVGNELARYIGTGYTDDLLSEFRQNGHTYYDQDGISSVTALSSSTGALANTYAYDTFGNPVVQTGSIVNPLQYTGRDYDAESGLYYNRARYYDRSSGRFINEDPAGLTCSPLSVQS